MDGHVAKRPMRRVFGVRDFRLLFAGVSTSLLGDQFVIIATPWLVLQLTADPLALGIVLALESIPRALFMLFGGAVTDRLSPRTILLVTDLARAVLTAMMALAVFSGAIRMWMLYAFGGAFGLMAGFAVPAGNSIVPTLVNQRDLQAGNSVVMGVGQLAGFVGPMVAGLLIAGFAGTLRGVGLAFGIDAFTFAASAAALWLMGGARGRTGGSSTERTGVRTEILEGLRYVWQDAALRLVLLVIAAVNFLFVGPIVVGVPVLASTCLDQGAAAFGLLMSGFAGGCLGGFLLAGVLPRPSRGGIRSILVASLASFGICLAVVGYIRVTWVLFVLMLGLGIGNGYLTILLFTSVQTRTPKSMLGRTMSLLLFASAGLLPVSQAISGAMAKWNLELLFAGAGALILLGTLWCAAQPALGDFAERLTESR